MFCSLQQAHHLQVFIRLLLKVQLTLAVMSHSS